MNKSLATVAEAAIADRTRLPIIISRREDCVVVVVDHLYIANSSSSF